MPPRSTYPLDGLAARSSQRVELSLHGEIAAARHDERIVGIERPLRCLGEDEADLAPRSCEDCCVVVWRAARAVYGHTWHGYSNQQGRPSGHARAIRYLIGRSGVACRRAVR